MSSSADDVTFRLPRFLAIGPLRLLALVVFIGASGALLWELVGLLTFMGQLVSPDYPDLGVGLVLFLLVWAAATAFLVWTQVRGSQRA